MRKFLFLTSFILIFNSCSVHKFKMGEGSNDGYKKIIKQHNFIGGLISNNTTEIIEIKGEKDYNLTIKRTISDAFISILSFGLYTPTTIIIEK